MTAPSCKDCAYVHRVTLAGRPFAVCVLADNSVSVLAALDFVQRAPGGPCGPDGKLFNKREGV